MSIGNVTASGLEQRVPIGATDVEYVELIQVFNQMLERLERSFKQASRFSGDAAHELKTPLAILQGELERTLQQTEPGSEVQQQARERDCALAPHFRRRIAIWVNGTPTSFVG